MQEPRSFESSLWDIISVALGTSTNIDAAFDTKVRCCISAIHAALLSSALALAITAFFLFRVPAFPAARNW
jgi:hypothetical protein